MLTFLTIPCSVIFLDHSAMILLHYVSLRGKKKQKTKTGNGTLTKLCFSVPCFTCFTYFTTGNCKQAEEINMQIECPEVTPHESCAMRVFTINVKQFLCVCVWGGGGGGGDCTKVQFIYIEPRVVSFGSWVLYHCYVRS